MTPHHHPHLPGNEHPNGHLLQLIAGLLVISVWVLDSFFFQLTTNLSSQIQWSIRVPVGVTIAVIGAYLAISAGMMIFDTEREEPGVITDGALGHVRHPLYLGVLILYLGIVITTLSMAAFAAFVVGFLIHDRLATFEERDLERVFGEDYVKYMSVVPKWIPSIKSKRP